jgi:hypothetical protein
MKAEIKAEWLAALRSGKYQQTVGRLRRSDSCAPAGYCCLGVLCDIVAPRVRGEWVVGAPDNARGDDFKVTYPEWLTGISDTELPAPMVAMLGLNNQSPFVLLPDDHPLLKDARLTEIFRGDPGRASLAQLNDRGFTFAEIADLIEELVEVTP